jgi:hypothetical protein
MTASVEAGQVTENKTDPVNMGIRAASFIDLHRKGGRTGPGTPIGIQSGFFRSFDAEAVVGACPGLQRTNQAA